MTLDEVVAFQRAMGLTDTHVVALEPEQFNLAHTQFERDCGMDLEQCPVHMWLNSYGGPPAEPGIYLVASPGVDGYSTSFRSIPWQLQHIGDLR